MIFFSQENTVSYIDLRKLDKSLIIKEKDLERKYDFKNMEISEINDVIEFFQNK